MQKNGLRIDVPLPDERIFRYQAMQDILHHLVNNPFEAFTQKELSQLTGSDISTVSRSVDLLEQLGVLAVQDTTPARIGISQDHLQRSGPVFTVPQAEFRSPIAAFLDELRTRVAESANVTELVGVLLFGSVARGTADRCSDIDLLVIADGSDTHVRRLASKVGREIETQRFDGDRYQFEVLAETPGSAMSHGAKLAELFDEGIVLERTDQLSDVRRFVYEPRREVN